MRRTPRAVPREDERNLDMLARSMREVWRGQLPPDGPVARNIVRRDCLMSLQRRSSFLSRALGGRRLTDLGAGEPASMAAFSASYGASEYVAVDSFRDYSKDEAPAGAVLVNDDMLRYLFRQPDGSSNIVMNAIDGVVLYNPDDAIASAYSELLVSQIARVVPAGGIAFGFMCPILGSLEGCGFSRIRRTDTGALGDMEALYLKPLRQI